MRRNLKIKMLLIILFTALMGYAQVPDAHDLSGPGSQNPAQSFKPILQDYISLALASNEGLRQTQLDYAAELSALKEAKGLFFPEISVNARYTVADGGRIISFPIGDLLNPVYSTLNLLTFSDQFPQVENEEFPFFRPREQETKLRLVQPIFNSDIIQNVKIRQQASEIAHISIEQYRRELIREVISAYYTFVKASQLFILADTSMALADENLRVSRSLHNNGLATIDAVYRSQAEISKVEVQQAQARNMLESSRAYFNFLLNRDLSEAVELGSENTLDPAVNFKEEPGSSLLSLEEATQMALAKRQELVLIKAYMDLNERRSALYKGGRFPGLSGVVDYGFQGEDYQFTQDDDFVMASLVLQWTLFQGRVNQEKIQRSKIEREKLQSMYAQAEQQVRLDVLNSYFGLQAARESIQSANNQLQALRRVYKLMRRKYQEGQASLLELIDARTSMIAASANLILARSDYSIKLADFYYAIGVSTYT